MERQAPDRFGIGSLFDRVTDAIVVLDVNSETVVLFNPAAEVLFGYTSSEVVGRSIDPLIPERFLSAHHEGLAHYRATGHGRLIDAGKPVEVTALRRGGEIRHVELSLSRITNRDGEGLYALAIVRDIEARKQAQRLFDERMEALEQADKLKDQFLSILSHELRTPINAIIGFGSILLDEVAGPLTSVQHEYLSKMMAGADNLMSLINDLLDMSRIQAGKFRLSPHPMQLTPVIHEVLEAMSPLVEQQHHEVRLEAPADLPQVMADGQRIRQVLVNLLNNAIKFTPQGGCIVVRASVVHAGLVCEIQDSGIGIAPEDLPKLFKPFSQVETGNARQGGGTGLGLSICKAIIESHGGTMGVQSQAGSGSSFWFSLPLRAAS